MQIGCASLNKFLHSTFPGNRENTQYRALNSFRLFCFVALRMPRARRLSDIHCDIETSLADVTTVYVCSDEDL